MASSAPASFDADVNLNVRKTRLFHLELGPSSLGLAFRDGVLNATLGGMELYDGHATGKLVFDASRDVPAFNGDFLLDGVQIKSLLSDAAQVSLLEGRTKLALQLSGTGENTEEIKSSLAGQGSIAVSDGAIEGVNLTEMIDQIGAGEIPELRQGPGAKTAFTDLGGSFTIKDGIAETNNLTATSPLLKVTAAGTVNLIESRINLLANPEIVAGPEGQRGANDLAGLSVPVRIEGPLDRPTISPEVKQLFADPEKAGKTVNQIGKALQKKFKGKPVGEAIGRMLGDIKIEQRGGGASGPQGDAPPSAKKEAPQAKPNADTGASDQGDGAEPEDPEIDRTTALGLLPAKTFRPSTEAARLAYKRADDRYPGKRNGAQNRLCQPRLPEGARRFRAHHHAASRRRLRALRELRGCRCCRGQHLRLPRQRQGGVVGRDRRGLAREWPRHRHGLPRRRIGAHSRRPPASARHHRPAPI